jgi:hypothetical protein
MPNLWPSSPSKQDVRPGLCLEDHVAVLGEPGKYPPEPISMPCHTQLTTPNQELPAMRPSTCPHDSKFLLTVCITMVTLNNDISSTRRVRKAPTQTHFCTTSHLTPPNQESLNTRPSTCTHDSEFLLMAHIMIIALEDDTGTSTLKDETQPSTYNRKTMAMTANRMTG